MLLYTRVVAASLGTTTPAQASSSPNRTEHVDASPYTLRLRSTHGWLLLSADCRTAEAAAVAWPWLCPDARGITAAVRTTDICCSRPTNGKLWISRPAAGMLQSNTATGLNGKRASSLWRRSIAMVDRTSDMRLGRKRATHRTTLSAINVGVCVAGLTMMPVPIGHTLPVPRMYV